MTLLYDLLARGHLPRELPPPFSSQTFATWGAAAAASATTNPPAQAGGQRPLVTRGARHSIPRTGASRRRLDIPHPLSHLLVAMEIAGSWKEFATHIGGGARPLFSASRPMHAPKDDRALIPRYRFTELPLLRARCRVSARYLLHVDIAQFYPSVYTHSIPWALHSRSVAKARRQDSTLLGNRVDTSVRNGQDQQTIGLPIGPDTSFLLAKSVLKAADDRLRAEAGASLHGFRYVDDYELACGSLREAEEKLAIIEATIAEFELRLNVEKTRIVETPAPLDAEWTAELRRLVPTASPRGERGNLIRFVSRAHELAAGNPKASVLKFAAAELRAYRPVTAAAWALLQALLMGFIAAEPASLPVVVELLVASASAGHGVRPDVVSDALVAAIERHAPVGHTAEVAWCLWTALVLDLPLALSTAGVQAMVSNRDNVCALLALDASQRGLLSLPPDAWASQMVADELVGSSWLLAYEAKLKGWGAGAQVPDYIAHDQLWNALRHAGVSFYDLSMSGAGASPVVTAAKPIPGGRLFGFYV